MILQVAMDFVHGKYRSSMLEKHGSAYYDSQTHNLIIRRYRVTLPSLSQSTPCTHTHTWPPVCLPGCRMCINLLKEQQQHTESVPATLVLSINILYLSPGADRTICKIQPFLLLSHIYCYGVNILVIIFFCCQQSMAVGKQQPVVQCGQCGSIFGCMKLR